MDTCDYYIRHAIARCKARGLLYHTSAKKWSRIHWGAGLFNGIISAAISIMAFISQRQGWNNSDIGMIGGLVLTTSNAIITSLKAGQNQTKFEKAGDEYLNLEEEILSSYSSTLGEEEKNALKEKCRSKLAQLTNKYREPDPQACVKLERQFFDYLSDDKSEIGIDF